MLAGINVDSPKLPHVRKGFGGYKVLKEYRAQCPKTLCEYLKEKSQNGVDLSQSFSEPVFASILLADISGFTKLSSILEVEDLKAHINNFFTVLLNNIIKKHKGDVIKFCGDACLIMWSCPVKSFHQDRRLVALRAVRCALDLLQEVGTYNSGSVSLRLHCGMSVGPVYCMSLGDDTRMEFLVSGPVLAEVGIAESEAEIGELCLSGAAYTLVSAEFNAEVMPKGSIKISSPRKKETDSLGSAAAWFPLTRFFVKSPFSRGRRSPKIYIDTGGGENEESNSLWGFVDHADATTGSGKSLSTFRLKPVESMEYQRAFSRYVNESVRARVGGSSNPGHEAELRNVTTIFIQLLNLDEDFQTGRHQRPQQSMMEILDSLRMVGGGALRQYLVDDKGCVAICCFGVPGFSSSNNSVKAITTALRIRDRLLQYDISCRIGIAGGMVYCGYVGSNYRKEYAMMGSSVNLAARLMGKCENQQILVEYSTYAESHDEFLFDMLQPITAKGYNDPVNVYSPRGHTNTDCTLEDIARRSNVVKKVPLVGRTFEMNILTKAFDRFVTSAQSTTSSNFDKLGSAIPSNKYVIIGGPGVGKSALIDEFVRQNRVLEGATRVGCHLANVYEPYEVIRQLFKGTISRSTSTSSKLCLHSSSTLDNEMKAGKSADDEDDEFLYISRTASKAFIEEDVEYQVLEDIYAEIVLWVQANLSDMKFSVYTDKSKHSQLSDGIPTPPFKRDDWDRYEYLMSSGSASFRRQLSVKANLSHSMDDDHSSPNETISFPVILQSRSNSQISQGSKRVAEQSPDDRPDDRYMTIGIMRLLPLLRICLDTAVNHHDELISQLSQEGINDILTSLCCEIIRALVMKSMARTLIVEDLQWCDKESFAILMRLADSMDSGLFVVSMRTSEETQTTSGRRYAGCSSFEGNTEVNSINDVTSVCRPLTLKPLNRHHVISLVKSSIKPSLIASHPNVISDKNIYNILVRSGGGVPGQVMAQIRKVETTLLQFKYGMHPRPSSSNRNGELPRFDKLSVESQIVLKMASVCGTTFSLYTVNLVLEKTGYLAIRSRTEKILVEIEEQGLIRRVFGMNDRAESKGHIVSVASPKANMDIMMLVSSNAGGSMRQASFRSMAGGNNPKLKMYAFLDKSFRENIYNIMLESLRESVHRIIAEDLEYRYEEETRPAYQDAETLAFHYTYAGDEAKQIYYTQQAARRAHESFMPLTAYHQLNRLFLLAFNQKSVEQVLQQYFRQPKSTYQSNYGFPLTRPDQFGMVFVMQLYLKSNDLCGTIIPPCKSISLLKAADYVAEMSILKYKICEITESFNLAVLAAHMLSRSRNPYLPFRYFALSTSSRRLIALNNFYQADICLMRGLLTKAKEYVQQALRLLPVSGELDGEKQQMLSVLRTIQLLMTGVNATKKVYMKAEPLIMDRGSVAFSYVQFHTGIVELARGDICRAHDIINGASTRTLRRDSSPLPLQVENLSIWLHYVGGNPQLLHDFLKSLSSEDQLLRKLWSLELISVIHIMKGDFEEARKILSKVSRLQRGRNGQCFHHALVGFISTFEGHHLYADVDHRDACVNSIMFAADVLAERVQTSPIGVVCLFFSVYAGQFILEAYGKKRNARPDNISDIVRKGGGLEYRLTEAVDRATACMKLVTRSFPLLRVLTDVLTMQRVRYMQEPAVPVFSVEYFVQNYRRDDVKQFVFGLAFWHHEKALYTKHFKMTEELMGMETALGRGQQSADMKSCYERLNIDNNHPIFGEDL